MYEDKFYKKFGKSNFKFISSFRDKEKKRTLLKLKCLKCEDIEIKEQYTLFRKEEVFCHSCNGRKKSNVLDKEKIRLEIQKKYGIDVKLKNNILQIKCKDCGKNFDNSIYDYSKKDITIKHVGYCIECSNNKRTWKNQHKHEDVHSWFSDRNLKLLSNYKNSYTDLNILCGCGNKFSMKFKNRLHYADDWIPKCEMCRKEEKLKKKKYNRNKFKGKDKTWSKYVKEKFNNKCFISGKITNLVSHHLYGYNKYSDLRYNINNGVCLCEEYHIKFHKKYDKFKGDCDFEQFKEFYFNETGKIYHGIVLGKV
jgi:hypothetical protein